MNKDYTVAELATMLSVSQRTLRRWIHLGALRAFRLPMGGYRISQAELDRIRQPYQVETQA